MFISYAQNQEDVMLFRALKGVEKGFYIDVGAQEPIIDSVTKAFYERGWRGINIEPVEEFHNKLLADRPKDINLNLALASRAGKLILHEFPQTGLSTTNDEYSLKHHEAGFEGHDKKVPCTTLNALCRKHRVKEIHFLKIDVEGSEADVIKGFSFKTIRPWILVVEATAPKTTQDTSPEWEDLVLMKGYKFVYFDGLNRFYVAREHIKLAKAFNKPPNYFDHYITYPFWKSQKELDRLRQVSGELSELDKYATDLRRENEHMAGRLAENSALTRAVAERDAKLTDLWAQNVAQQKQIQAIYSSSSWKLTAPMRASKKLMLGFARASSYLVRGLRTAIRGTFFGGVRFILKGALRISWMRESGRLVLKNFPQLKKRILLWAGSGEIQHFDYGIPFIQDTNENSVEHYLPETARSIYAELCQRCLPK